MAKMSQEDSIVNQLIDIYGDYYNTEFGIEVPYNNYGDKGVVDLIIKSSVGAEDIYEDEYIEWRNDIHASNPIVTKDNALRIVEIKSEYAIEEATGANEILRQFRKHQEHFFAGSDYSTHDWDDIHFWLIFERTEVTEQHIRQNYNMYNQTDGFIFIYYFETNDLKKLPDLPHGNNARPLWLKTCDGIRDCYRRVAYSSGDKYLCNNCYEKFSKNELDESHHLSFKSPSDFGLINGGEK